MHRVSRILFRTMTMAALGLVALAIPPWPAAQGQPAPAEAPKKNWKDPGEYDMYNAATKEADNKKKLALLDAWREKYPASDYKEERLVYYLNAYQQLGDLHHLVDTLNEMLTMNPKQLQLMGPILYYVMVPQYNDTGPATLDMTEKVANSVLANIDNKPANVSDADWPKGRQDFEALAHKAFGWVAMNRKNSEAAEQEFLKTLKINPNQGEVDYWIGNMLRAQKTPEKQSQALFYYARAATYDGQGSLPAEVRKSLDDYLRKAYATYHGPDDASLNELRNQAKSQPFPPEGFKIKTANEIAIEKEEEFKKSNPQLAMWMSLKKELTGPNGPQFFESNMKGAEVPGGAGGVKTFKARLISAKPPVRSKELVVGLADPSTPEITLKLDAALAGKPKLGDDIEFSGVPSAFTPDPFMVTFEVEKAKIQGLNLEKPPVAPKKAAGTKKKKAA